MCVIGGFLTIFTVRTTYQNVYNSNSVFSQTKATTSLSVDNIGTGLLIMVLGPIIVRIVYELIMLTIVAVRNIMEINKKMPGNPEEPEAPAEPATPMEPVNPTTEVKIVEAAENSTEL